MLTEAQTYEKYLLNQTNFELTVSESYKVQAMLAVKDEYTFDFAKLSPEDRKEMLPEPEEIAERLKIFEKE